jgi:hypothetical protein
MQRKHTMAKGYNQFLEGIVGKVGAIVVTTNGQQTIMRKRVYRNTSDTAAQRVIRANITGLAHLWVTLTPVQMAAWHTLGLQMPDKAGTRALNNYQAFTSVNGVLLACGQPTVSDAPAAPSYPASLPPVLLTAGSGPSSPFALTLSSAAYTGLVMVYAAAPASPGRNSFSRSQFKLITTLTGLTAGSTSLTTAYEARFGTPSAGRKIALLLTPVSATGFKGTSVEPTALVSASTSVAAPTAADHQALKAA